MLRVLVAIPLFNHGAQVGAVLERIMALRLSHDFSCLVVDDGSTDNGVEVVHKLMTLHNEGVQAKDAMDALPLNLVVHPKNMGKGKAIVTASEWAAERGFTHVITLDADGQYLPEELPLFFEALCEDPGAIWVGRRNFQEPKIPRISSLGRRLTAWFLRAQTGTRPPDVLSGFRAYPMTVLTHIKCSDKRYAFEAEVLVRASWAGFRLRSLPVQVNYLPKNERVTHYAKTREGLRLAAMNLRLTLRALVPVPFSQHQDCGTKLSIRKPIAAMRALLGGANTPMLLALSTFIAVLVNMLPTLGVQNIMLLFIISWLKLNRVWTLAVAHMCWPPITIFISVEAGYFIRHGEFLTEISWQTIGKEGFERIWEWILGGLVFGPVFSLACAALVFLVATKISQGGKAAAESPKDKLGQPEDAIPQAQPMAAPEPDEE